MSEIYDVFLSHNSQETLTVRQIAEELKARKIKVWLDEWILIPGRRWIPELEKALETTKTAAILVGESGFGRWEQPEYEGALSEFVERGLPIIPVLLPGATAEIKFPLFLKGFTWVDLRGGITQEGMEQLVWGIKGGQPDREMPTNYSGLKVHNLPFLPLGDLFKGRNKDLCTLEANLYASNSTTPITPTVIYGLDGIGKTRLAVDYAWRNRDRYDAVLFVRVDSPAALQSGFAGLAHLGLPGLTPISSNSQDEEVAAVLAWLQEHDRWLLILDNVATDEEAEAVRNVLPKLQGKPVLITSRRRNWPAGIRKQPLGELSVDEATAFLLQRTDGERAPSKDDPELARQLAEILDGLPLALEQAAAYIGLHQITFSKYLEIWEKEKEKVLEWHDEDQTENSTSVVATWQATFSQIHPSTAAAILRLISHLAPDPIPLDMFEKGDSLVEEAVGLLLKETKQKGTPQTVQEGLTELAAYSMVIKKGETGIVHRIVQEVVRERIPKDCRREWIELALRLVNEYAPFEVEDVRTWPIWNLLRPHAILISAIAEEEEINSPTSRLLTMVSLLYKTRGLYLEAEPLVRRALELSEKVFGPDHSEAAVCLNNLASLLQSTNRLAEAEPLMRRALKIDEDSFGMDHPNVARDLNNLAQLLQSTNRLEEAESLMRQALKIIEGSYGRDHPKVAIRLNNLGQLLQSTNRSAEAEPLMRQALKIDEDSFGQIHPNVARDLNNLALLLQATSRLAEAEPLMRRALKIDEDSFGQIHPNVARDLNNLALLLQATNRLAEAEPLMRRAVEIFEASLGPDHPNSKIARGNLEALLAAMELGSEPIAP